MTSCILCKQGKTSIHSTVKNYTYYHCPNCDLVFVNPRERLSPAEEKIRYDRHENDPGDPRYRKFLSQLFDPLNKKIKPSSCGLDYGSGPGPTLSVMFEEAGHQMEIFDPYYSNNPAVLNNTYDFISTTETAEHFYQPGEEFEKLWEMLAPGGYLGIMTLLRPENIPIEDWHYIGDDTHVSLYSKKTFRWLSEKMNAELTIIGNRVIIFRKLV